MDKQFANAYHDRDLHELVGAAQAGEQLALEELLRRFRPLITSMTRKYFIKGSGDSQDLYQEACLGFFTAIRDYDLDSKVPFESFAKLCIRRKVLSAVKYHTCKKNQFFFNAISLEERVYGNSDKSTELRYQDIIGDGRQEAIDDGLNCRELFEKIVSLLTEYECQVFKLYVAGYSYVEISKLLNKKAKSVDNALMRIKRKLKQNEAELLAG